MSRMPGVIAIAIFILPPVWSVAAQTRAPLVTALTPEQIKASESLAAKYDRSAAMEQSRLAAFKNRPLGGAIQKTFNVIANYMVLAAQMMPESGYSFRPTPDVRTFGEQMNHSTGAHYSFCNQAGLPAGITRKGPPNLRDVTAKAEIVKALDDSIAYCNSIIAAATEAWLMEIVPNLGGASSGLIEAPRAHAFHYNNFHDGEDYGTITTYLRMNGVVPPSTALAAVRSPAAAPPAR